MLGEPILDVQLWNSSYNCLIIVGTISILSKRIVEWKFPTDISVNYVAKFGFILYRNLVFTGNWQVGKAWCYRKIWIIDIPLCRGRDKTIKARNFQCDRHHSYVRLKKFQWEIFYTVNGKTIFGFFVSVSGRSWKLMRVGMRGMLAAFLFKVMRLFGGKLRLPKSDNIW